MPNVLIRDVPDDVHRELRRRADRAGQSLQHYVLQLLAQSVALPTIEDWLDEARTGARQDLSAAEIVGLVRSDRDDRR
ncbi:MAG: hypothetical protein AAF567_16475 [Actinomycetota bacterium]